MVTYYLWWVLWYFKEFKNAKLDKWQKMLSSLRSNPYWRGFGWCYTIVKDVRSGSGVTQNRAELLRSGRELTTKVGEQPWPQLVCCALICCHVYSCIFQEDWIVARSLGEEWYRLIGVRIGQGRRRKWLYLRTKELGCNYWSTYTKSGIGGVQVTSLHRDPIGVDNRSLGAKN